MSTDTQYAVKEIQNRMDQNKLMITEIKRDQLQLDISNYQSGYLDGQNSILEIVNSSLERSIYFLTKNSEHDRS